MSAPTVSPGTGHPADDRPARHLDPLLTAWAIWLVLLGLMLVTYSRIDPLDLYHVTGEGLAGGLSRVVVQVNFPIALVAISLVLICLDALDGRWTWWGAAAIALCAVAAWPGVVDDGDLDVRWINAVPALGVGIAAVMTVATLRRGVERPGRLPLDAGRWALGTIAVLVSIPWIAADLGVYLPGRIFIMEEALAADRVGEIAVHYGHHHGFDGALLLITALVLSRARLHRGGLAAANRIYVSLLGAYGAVNLVQDGWNEQLVKRGWIDWWMPSATHPGLNSRWAVIVVLAVVGVVALTWEARRADAASDHETVG